MAFCSFLEEYADEYIVGWKLDEVRTLQHWRNRSLARIDRTTDATKGHHAPWQYSLIPLKGHPTQWHGT